ncbi:MAG: hypothetical protein EXX96DRAFT_616388 [Benjaminiella poitrasii]|nr:MAG: hypothetical protein EXX96DRAFT_616388 [Benjaminiella poitrasii]
MTKLYIRNSFRRAMKNRLNDKKLTSNVDVLMYLDFILFLDRLAKASEQAAAERHATYVKTEDIDKVLENTLREFRG